MKKLGLTLLAVFCFAASTFAAGNQPTTAKWEGNININKLSKYLKLTSNQSEEVANICDYFTEQMGKTSNSSEKQNELLKNAVYSNLKLMKKTLTDAQYRKYAIIMNITLQNKGIKLK